MSDARRICRRRIPVNIPAPNAVPECVVPTLKATVKHSPALPECSGDARFMSTLFTSVSYTHLDVYKRQAQPIAVIGPTQSPTVGSTFTVNITATGSTDLYAFQFDLVYNPAILSVVSVTAGKLPPGGGSTVFLPGSINNNSGAVTLNTGTLIGSIPGAVGSGTLVAVQFSAVGPGASAVSVQNLILLNSTLSNMANAASIQNASVLVVNSGSSVPSITPGGVVPVYSSATTIQSGSWVSIYGNNLAGGTTSWNGNFPTSLGGVNVTINAKPAYLWFVSPTQINLQAPTDPATGTVNVVVTTCLLYTSRCV